MKQAMKFDMVPASKIMLSPGGVSLLEVNRTISEILNETELATHSRAINKVMEGKKLNARDLKVLDKIDEITMKAHGMCLKDSLVTKARIKACKRYGVEFIDRDGLIDHMDMMLGTSKSVDELKFSDEIVDMFIQALGLGVAEKFSEAVLHAYADVQLGIEELVALAKVKRFSEETLQLTITGKKVLKAIEEACSHLGVNFETLGTETTESTFIH